MRAARDRACHSPTRFCVATGNCMYDSVQKEVRRRPSLRFEGARTSGESHSPFRY
jgi:hypothetical protein